VFYSYAAREALANWCGTASAFTRVFNALWQGPRLKIAKTTPCKESNPLKTKESLAWIFHRKKPFDTSGKSGAHLHHPPIWQKHPRRRATARFASKAAN
jgi:hypothetical protein